MGMITCDESNSQLRMTYVHFLTSMARNCWRKRPMPLLRCSLSAASVRRFTDETLPLTPPIFTAALPPFSVRYLDSFSSAAISPTLMKTCIIHISPYAFSSNDARSYKRHFHLSSTMLDPMTTIILPSVFVVFPTTSWDMAGPVPDELEQWINLSETSIWTVQLQFVSVRLSCFLFV